MPEVHRVAFDGPATLYVEEFGRAHAGAAPRPGHEHRGAVVFGHSLLCDGRIFSDQVTDLAQDHHVLNLDFRGHGRSDPPPRSYTLADVATDYLRAMDALSVERATLVGLSMGGMAALLLALSHPERVAGLVLIDTSASAERPHNRARQLALATTARLFGPRPWLVRQATALLFGATFRAQHPDEVAVWEQRIAALNRAGLARGVAAVAGRRDVTARLPDIVAPTLVIVGDEDTATPPVYARTLAAAVPHARLEVLPATGHLASVERPRVVAKLIRQFLTGRATPG